MLNKMFKCVFFSLWFRQGRCSQSCPMSWEIPSRTWRMMKCRRITKGVPSHRHSKTSALSLKSECESVVTVSELYSTLCRIYKPLCFALWSAHTVCTVYRTGGHLGFWPFEIWSSLTVATSAVGVLVSILLKPVMRNGTTTSSQATQTRTQVHSRGIWGALHQCQRVSLLIIELFQWWQIVFAILYRCQ